MSVRKFKKVNKSGAEDDGEGMAVSSADYNNDGFPDLFVTNYGNFKLYKNNNVYVNLARIESFGVTMIEAIAAGLHVVSFNTKGANEIIVNNQNGYIVNEYKPEEMAKVLIAKFNDNSFNKINTYKEIMKYDLEVNVKLILKNYV